MANIPLPVFFVLFPSKNEQTRDDQKNKIKNSIDSAITFYLIWKNDPVL